jgi:capsular exopolysaccharide synthesis family protein
MTQSSFEIQNHNDLGYGQLLAIVWRRRFWFFGVFVGVMSVAVPLALKKETIYESSMQLLVEPNYESKSQGQEEQFTESKVEIDYATQLNLMRSSGLIQQAVNKLQLEYPEISVGEIRKYLSLSQVQEEGKETRETKIFQVFYTSYDPNKTQRVLEVIQQVYLEYNLLQQEQRLQNGLSFINKQLPLARQELLEAESALKQFRIENNLVDPQEEANAVAASLKSIQQEREKVRADYQEARAGYLNSERQLDTSSTERALISARLSESERFQKLLDQLQEIELELKKKSIYLTDANPIIQDLLDKRQQQQKLLREEIERVLGKVSPQLDLTKLALQKEGQFGKTEQDLVGELAKAQTKVVSTQERNSSLAETERELRQELTRFPKLIAEYNSLEQEVEVQRASLEQLLRAKQDLSIEINRGGFKWQVVEPPLPGYVIGPNTKQDIMLGGVVALFLGGVAAFMREGIDRVVHSSEQLQQQTAFPLLGELPQLSQSQDRFSVSLPWHSSLELNSEFSTFQIIQWQPFQESLDLIYMNLQLLHVGSQLKSLAVTSAIAEEGKSTLVLGLAFSAARLHQRVLLIDADLRQPSLHKKLNLPNRQGLSNLLTGETDVPNIQNISESDSNVDVLTAGPIPMDPVKLLGSQKFKQLLEEFEQSYDIVLLDTPPALGMVDALQTASYCHGVLMVARLDRVAKSELSEATSLLSKLNLIGLIANGDRDKRPKFRSYVGQNRNLLPLTTESN